MRARLMAIVLSMLMGLGLLLLGAGAASASTPAPDASSLGHVAAQQPAAVPDPGAVDLLAAGDESGPSIHGTIRALIGPPDAKGNPTRAPIPGVSITVLQDGKKIGTATTDDEGKWSVSVPEPGTYQVQLVTSSLPDTVKLENAGKDTLPKVRAQGLLPGIAIFPLVPASGAVDTGMSNVAYYTSLTLKGLRFGLIIAMAAVGLSLVFGTTGLINFAHGELVTIGAVITYVFSTSAFHWPFIIAVILAIVLLALFGGVLDRVLWLPLRKRGSGLIQMFIVSIGLSLFLRYLILFFFGGERHFLQFAQDRVNSEKWHFGSLVVDPMNIVIIIISIIVLLAVALMLQKTRMGKAMRALSDNRDLAEASGIDVQRVITQTWIIGGGLAGFGGVLYGLTTAVYWNEGYFLLLLMFAGVILGGLGSAYGAMLGSIIIGLVVQMSVAFSPSSMQNAWALLLLIIVLLVRPQGILGRLQRAG